MVYPNQVPHHIKPRLVPPSWALTNEIVYYLLISIGISKTRRRTFIWLILSVGYYMFTYLFYDIPTYRYSAIWASSLPFALGAALYWINRIKPLKRVNLFSVIGVYGLFVSNALFFNKQNLGVYGEASIYINLVLAVLLIYMLFNFKSKNLLKHWDNYVGRYSYPIYLAHYLVLIFYSAIFLT